MKLDLRIPLGLMFTIVGLILSIFGAIYEQSAGLDINLIWGLVIQASGATMFLLGRRADRKPKDPPLTDDRVWRAGHGH
ncbi:MAG TPA: hypothetical protein VME18_11145 [Acidobacteriaceae bacterium]|nr:hypothetical protein [Acidobacteriaceae bacterium]